MERKIKLYLASPWFNPEQDEREQRVKARLRELGFEVFSPREAGELPHNATIEDQQKIFEIDMNSIIHNDAVFAITNGKDMGTIWECGFAYGYSKAMKTVSSDFGFEPFEVPVIYFAEGLNGPFNIMLARSGILTYTNLDDVTYEEIASALESGVAKDFEGEIE